MHQRVRERVWERLATWQKVTIVTSTENRQTQKIVMYLRQPMHDEQSAGHSSQSGELRIESSNSSPNSLFNNSSPLSELSAILSFPIPTRSRMASGLSPSLYGSGSATQPRQEEHESHSILVHFSLSEAAPTVLRRKERER